MKTLLKLTPVIGTVALLAACGQTMEQRAATGALGGAVAGQVVGGNTGSTVAGAALPPRDHAEVRLFAFG
jgi:osmotically inducible lipoprotein OsmB